MRLSMWILYDWLRKYHPESRITKGEQTLRSARILSADTRIERQNVYLARASEFISGEDNKVICVHEQDLLLLNTDDLDAVLNDIFDAFDFYNSWADGITGEIQSGCSVQKIIDLSHPVFGQPILVYNTSNEIIGLSSAFPKGSLDDEWDAVLEDHANSLGFLVGIQELLLKQRTLYDAIKIHVPGTPYPSVYKGLFHERIWLGRIIFLESSHELSKGEWQLFDTFCELTERWAAESYRSNLLKTETGIFLDIIEGRSVSPEELDHKLQMTGWKMEDLKKLIRIEIPQTESEITQVLYNRLERTFPASYVIHSQNELLILTDTELVPEAALKQLLKPVLREAGLYAVCSYPFTNIFLLAQYHEQCVQTCLHCPKVPGVLYDCSDYALLSIRSLIRSMIPGVLQHPAVDALKQYDMENRSELYPTLFSYLRNNCNMAETARQLHLHRNSLLYRLNQIRELYDVPLEDPDTREHLLLSYYMQK